jgi:hypothetical protein
MSSSSSSADYYDLTAVESDSDIEAVAAVIPPPSGRRQIAAVMDDGGIYHTNTRSSSASDGRSNSRRHIGHGSQSATTITTSVAHSESRQHRVSIIDLVNDSEEEKEGFYVATDAHAEKKRNPPLRSSLPPNNFKTTTWTEKDIIGEEEGDIGSTNNSSSQCFVRHTMRRKRSRTPSLSLSTTISENTISHTHHRIGIASSQHAFIPTTNTTTTTAPHAYLNIPSRNCPSDGATITFGLLSLIDVALKDGNASLTCEGSMASSRNKLLKRSPIHHHPMPPPSSCTVSHASSSSLSSSAVGYHCHHHHLPYNHQPFHYLQHDNWSCGYRNLQMLLSSMMPSLLSLFLQGVPCIEEIQRTMEVLWSRGYDLRNAEHHNYKLVGKKTWIGAVEVWYVCCVAISLHFSILE